MVVVKCTGACCRAFTLMVKGKPVDAHRVRVSESSGFRPFRHLAVVLERGEQVKQFGQYHVFTCRELSADGRCQIHETKPDVCRRFPDAFTCGHCGALSDAEARGVALGPILQPYDVQSTS